MDHGNILYKQGSRCFDFICKQWWQYFYSGMTLKNMIQWVTVVYQNTSIIMTIGDISIYFMEINIFNTQMQIFPVSPAHYTRKTCFFQTFFRPKGVCELYTNVHNTRENTEIHQSSGKPYQSIGIGLFGIWPHKVQEAFSTFDYSDITHGCIPHKRNEKWF